MDNALGLLQAELERTQTLRSKDIDADALIKALMHTQGALDQHYELDADVVRSFASDLVSWLRAHEDFEDALCIRALLKILSRLLGRDASADSIMIQKGLLSSTASLLSSHLSDALMAKCCLEVLAPLSIVESSDAIISRLGIVALVLELLQKHRDNAVVLEDAITTLALMAKRTRHRKVLSQRGNVVALVDLLKRNVCVSHIVIAVCRFLCNFAVKEECSIMVLSNGGVDALMAAFDNHAYSSNQDGSKSSADVRANVASAIWTCATDCGDVQAALFASGWLTSLMSALQVYSNNAELHEAAFGIIRSLSRNAAYRQDIVDLGVIPTTIQGMQTFSDNKSLVKEACGIFGNLATDPCIRVELGQSGAMQEAFEVLSHCCTNEDRKVAKLALGALSNMASSEENRDLLARLQTAPVVLEAARIFMHNEIILEYAIGAISHLALHPDCNRQLVEAGAVEALLLFLGEHSEDRDVVSKSLIALRRMLKHHTAKGDGSDLPLERQIARAGRPEAGGTRGIGLLVEAMQAHLYDEIVAKETALLLASLARSPPIVPVLMSVAVQPCMKAMEVHQNETPTADALADLLARLPLEEDEQWVQGTSLPHAG
mmetsp:Transcript_88803/g.250140  ORF Transcript_88803/g.250140 Transcript_88803/m.250140 type:complete len:604 (+) Transcript_88803:112-1923(+)